MAKIEVFFPNGTKTVIYGRTPLQFAEAIMAAYQRGDLPHQNKQTVEDAIAFHGIENWKIAR